MLNHMGTPFRTSETDVSRTSVGEPLGIKNRTICGHPQGVTLGRPQDVIFRRPEDFARGRPQDVGMRRPLALHIGPFRNVHTMSFGGVLKTSSRCNFVEWASASKES